MSWYFAVLVTIGAFFLMEATAWFTHKYIMHGLLWTLHKDHHQKEHDGFWEHNDWFFVIFAVPSCVCILTGIASGFDFKYWMGIGFTLYGLAYFFVHDVFIHQRVRWLRSTKNIYLLALRKAHKMHHKHLGPERGECFGMLIVPWKYFVEVKRNKTRTI